MVGGMNAPSTDQESEVLCSITTAATFGDPPMDWRVALDDAARLGLDRFALFLTGLDPEQRKPLYQELLSHRLRHDVTIPFVHARSDMHPDEYRFLTGEFGTERFNLHRARQRPHKYPLSEELRSRTYIENAWRLQESDLEKFAGICLDFSHMEAIMYEDAAEYPKLEALLDSFPIGANHVSAFTLSGPKNGRRDRHFTTSPTDFDYLAGFPRRYFGRFVAIELANPLEEQLAIKARLETLLARR